MTAPSGLAAGRVRVRWLGRLPYAEAWDLQRAFWEGRTLDRSKDDYLLLLEHPNTYTVGRNGNGSNLLIPEGQLAPIGAEIHHVDRGGSRGVRNSAQSSWSRQPEVRRSSVRAAWVAPLVGAAFGVTTWSSDWLSR